MLAVGQPARGLESSWGKPRKEGSVDCLTCKCEEARYDIRPMENGPRLVKLPKGSPNAAYCGGCAREELKHEKAIYSAERTVVYGSLGAWS